MSKAFTSLVFISVMGASSCASDRDIGRGAILCPALGDWIEAGPRPGTDSRELTFFGPDGAFYHSMGMTAGCDDCTDEADSELLLAAYGSYSSDKLAVDLSRCLDLGAAAAFRRQTPVEKSKRFDGKVATVKWSDAKCPEGSDPWGCTSIRVDY